MKRAATYAIAALAKRPVMRRRQPSAGDLFKLADPQQGSVAAGAGAPAVQEPSASGDSATAPCNGTAGQAHSTVSSSTLSTDTAATAAGSGVSEASSSGRSGSPVKEAPQLRVRSSSVGRSGHARRKSYGEWCLCVLLTVCYNDFLRHVLSLLPCREGGLLCLCLQCLLSVCAFCKSAKQH